MVWARNAELIKKNFAHIRVEMLARMHQGFAQASGFGNGFRDDAGFDELWAGTDDGEDFFHVFIAGRGLEHPLLFVICNDFFIHSDHGLYAS